MALSASNVVNEPRSWSIGPVKVQIMTFTVASGDTSGTITADGLSEVIAIQQSPLALTAEPSFSGNVITLAFADPAATLYGQIIVFGK